MLNGVLIADYFLSRHALVDGGLDYGSLTGRRGSFKWAEVTRVHYAPFMKWFKLEAGSGRVARISSMMTGLPAFAEAVLAYVPQSAIDDDTRSVLQATAEGNPPQVW